MIKRISLLIMAALLVATIAVMTAAPGFAKITKTNPGDNTPSGEARGIPAKNPAGKCPPGQNKNLSPGGEKKCR